MSGHWSHDLTFVIILLIQVQWTRCFQGEELLMSIFLFNKNTDTILHMEYFDSCALVIPWCDIAQGFCNNVFLICSNGVYMYVSSANTYNLFKIIYYHMYWKQGLAPTPVFSISPDILQLKLIIYRKKRLPTRLIEFHSVQSYFKSRFVPANFISNRVLPIKPLPRQELQKFPHRVC